MLKEIIIIIVVVSLVIGVDIVSNQYTQNAVEELSAELNELRLLILSENKEDSKNQMRIIKAKWAERYNILAYYIEHDELEKVETELVKLSADIDTEEFKQGICELDTTIFILKHIQKKEQLQITSIF